jgi:hypothetical protein
MHTLLSRQRLLSGLGIFLAVGMVAPVTARAGILDASWTAPTTNTDGSPLTDLASFTLYYGENPTPCSGSTFVDVPAPASAPEQNQTVSQRLRGLTTGTRYYAAISAVSAGGVESVCTTVSTAIARLDFDVAPSGTIDFGSVDVGGAVDRAFTVQNTGGGTVSGTVTTSAPFSIVSGGSFSLLDAGASTTVTVRFAPTAGAAATGNVTFAANGGSVVEILTGVGVAPNPAPTLTSLSPSSATVGGEAFLLTVSGTGFVPTSTVAWNGAPRTTTYVSPTELRAAIPASDIAFTGRDSITVTNPTPGGGTSTAETFRTRRSFQR